MGLALLARGGGCGSTLTEDGSKLLEAYQSTLSHLEKTAELMLGKIIEERFGRDGETASEEGAS